MLVSEARCARFCSVREVHRPTRSDEAPRRSSRSGMSGFSSMPARASVLSWSRLAYGRGIGLRFEGGGRSIVVSGDTRPCENLMRWSHGVDCLIHECCEMSKTSWYPGCGWATIEEKIQDLASYHTQPADIGRVARGAGAKK